MHSFFHRLAHEAVKLVGEEGMNKMNKAFTTEHVVHADVVINWIKDGRKGTTPRWG